MGIWGASETFTKRLILWPEGASPGPRASFPSQSLTIRNRAQDNLQGTEARCPGWDRSLPLTSLTPSDALLPSLLPTRHTCPPGHTFPPGTPVHQGTPAHQDTPGHTCLLSVLVPSAPPSHALGAGLGYPGHSLQTLLPPQLRLEQSRWEVELSHSFSSRSSRSREPLSQLGQQSGPLMKELLRGAPSFCLSGTFREI